MIASKELVLKIIDSIPEAQRGEWIELIKKRRKDVERLFLEVPVTNFDKYQWTKAKEGFQLGFEIEKILIYARPEFNGLQMERIITGIRCLKLEEVLILARSEFNEAQMNEILKGFILGLSISQVSLYARKELNAYQMRQIRVALERGLTIAQIRILCNHEIDDTQMEQGRKSLEEGLNESETLEVIEKKDFYQMREHRLKLVERHKKLDTSMEIRTNMYKLLVN